MRIARGRRTRRRGRRHDRRRSRISTCWRPRASTSSARPARSSAGRCCSIRSARTPPCLLHLARKAFYPAKPPFPLLHVDTTWKFRDMIAFRDRTVRELGLELIVHVNEEGRAQGINPIDLPPLRLHRRDEDAGAAAGTATSTVRRGLRRRAPRRGGLARQGARVLVPLGRRIAGTRAGSGRRCGVCSTADWGQARRPACSRSPIGPRRTCGATSPARHLDVVPLYFAAERPTSAAAAACSCATTSACRCCAGESVAAPPGALPHAGLLAADRRDRIRCRPTSTAWSPRRWRRASPSARAGLIDHDEAGAMERKKQEGYF